MHIDNYVVLSMAYFVFKEFFEKKRMQNRHNLLTSPPASPKKGNVGNMDLLTLFIVNQIALKKEHTGK